MQLLHHKCWEEETPINTSFCEENTNAKLSYQHPRNTIAIHNSNPTLSTVTIRITPASLEQGDYSLQLGEDEASQTKRKSAHSSTFVSSTYKKTRGSSKVSARSTEQTTVGLKFAPPEPKATARLAYPAEAY